MEELLEVWEHMRIYKNIIGDMETLWQLRGVILVHTPSHGYIYKLKVILEQTSIFCIPASSCCHSNQENVVYSANSFHPPIAPNYRNSLRPICLRCSSSIISKSV